MILLVLFSLVVTVVILVAIACLILALTGKPVLAYLVFLLVAFTGLGVPPAIVSAGVFALLLEEKKTGRVSRFFNSYMNWVWRFNRPFLKTALISIVCAIFLYAFVLWFAFKFEPF